MERDMCNYTIYSIVVIIYIYILDDYDILYVCVCVCGHWNVNHFPGGFDISVQDNGEGNSYGSSHWSTIHGPAKLSQIATR